MSTTKSPPCIWVGQPLHYVFLMVLSSLAWFAWAKLGKPFPIAFWVAIAVPVMHQVFTLLAWRLELRAAIVSNAIGFGGYLALFFSLFLGRFVAIALLAWLDRESLGLCLPLPSGFTSATVLPGLYARYSVALYFGMTRAAGADHFDAKYRNVPLVNQGIFRYTNNGMYVYAFLLFWAIALGFDSSAALVVAAFSHAYIWVHFFATEKPDMEYLYHK